MLLKHSGNKIWLTYRTFLAFSSSTAAEAILLEFVEQPQSAIGLKMSKIPVLIISSLSLRI